MFTSALKGSDYQFAAPDKGGYDVFLPGDTATTHQVALARFEADEVPDVDEGFDGLDLYYASDLLVKTSVAIPSRVVPALMEPADYLSLPYGANEDEFHLSQGAVI